jgi:uncharacterized protein YjbI with pentapeptide repeats
MATAQPEMSRSDEIRLIWSDHQWLYIVIGFLGGLLCFPALQFVIEDLSSLIRDFVPEAVGILITVALIDRLNRQRDIKNAEKQLHEQLARSASSIVNDVASDAVHQMSKQKRKSLLPIGENLLKGENGLLKGADLQLANLQDANLSAANLQTAYLAGANLRGANLWYANLQEASIWHADLRDAKLEHVNLQNANLEHASLQGANLWHANLQNANLPHARLQGSKLVHADLRNAKLAYTSLQGANLGSANLNKASIRNADLHGADLRFANLQDADLRDTNLQAVNLEGANLHGAKLEGAQFLNAEGFSVVRADRNTILPDGTRWEPTQISAFPFNYVERDSNGRIIAP